MEKMMEKSENWRTHALIISTMEQYVGACRGALDAAKMDLTYYLGPHGFEAIINYPLLPPLPEMPATGCPAGLLEKLDRVDRQYKQQNVELEQIRKMMHYMNWVWSWAEYSPMRHYYGRIMFILDCFSRNHKAAVQTFRTRWTSLSKKLTKISRPSSSSSCSSPCSSSASNTINDWTI